MNPELKAMLEKIKNQIVPVEIIQEMIEKAGKSDNTEEFTELKSKFDNLLEEIAEMKKGEATGTQDDDTESKHDEVFKKYMRYGKENLTESEKKTMISSNDTTGGYLAGQKIDKQIVKDVREMNAMMAVAKVITTKSKDYVYIRVNNLTATTTKAEAAEVTAADITFERITINTFPYMNVVALSEEVVEDAEIDIIREVTTQMADAIAEGSEVDMLTGNGVNKAEGILTATGTGAVSTATASTFIDEDIISLVGGVKGKYRRTGSFMASKEILTHIAKMKDGSGRFQFSMEPLEKYPLSIATLMNRPVYEAPSMATTVATGNKVLMFGDFGKAYVVVMTAGTKILRDQYSSSTSGVVKYIGRKRIGGQTVQPEAVAILTVS